MKSNVIVLTTILLLCILLVPVSVCANTNVDSVCVPDEYTAAKVGEIILKVIFRDFNFESTKIFVAFDFMRDEWTIWAQVVNSSGLPIGLGGAPTIRMKRINAEVTYIGTQL